MKIKKIITVIFCSALLASCSSVPEEIPQDMTAQELIQKGQAAFESRKYKLSLRYYNAVTERFANDPAVYIEATYEIGHLFFKQKDYEKAEPIFQEIISIYENAQPGALPGAYKKLAQLSLEKIKAKNE